MQAIEPKTMLVRMPKDLWVFMKTQTIVQETSANSIMLSLIEKFKLKCEKKVDG
jgi:hypothetical protein